MLTKKNKKLLCVVLAFAAFSAALFLALIRADGYGVPVSVCAENVTELSLDFSVNDGDAFDAHYLSGWIVADGVYKPAAAGAITKTIKTVDLTSTVYVSFDFYADAYPFDVFFTEDLNSSWQGIGAHLYDTAGGVFTVNKNLDRNEWLGDCVVNYVDGKAHNLKIRIEGRAMSFYMDGSETPLGFNGNSVSSFSLDIPVLSDKAQIIFRAYGENTYIDNLIISASDVPYTEPEQPTNAYTELSLDFSEENLPSYFAPVFDSAGWRADGGKFYPAAAWAVTKVVQPIDLSVTTYISFDFFAAVSGSAKKDTQFNLAFLPDCSAQNGFGIHAYYSEGTAVLTVNESLSRVDWIADYVFPWDDGKEHNLKIKLGGGKVAYFIDGISVSFADGETEFDIPVTETEVYLALQSSEIMSCIDNFTVSESDVVYVAPEPYPEFSEFTSDFSDGSGFIASANEGWKAENGAFLPQNPWSVAQYGTVIPFDGEKTVKFTFKAGEDGNGSQFNVGFVKETASGGVVSSSGLSLHIYKPDAVQFNVSYWFGNPFDSIISSKNANYLDGVDHTLKMIIKERTIAVVVDNEIMFKDIPLNMDAGYFTVQSTSVQTEIKDFSIKNKAESLNIPDGSGDVSYGETEEKPAAEITVTDFGKKPDGVKLTVAIVCGAVAVISAVITVVITIKTKKNKEKTTDEKN